MHKLNPIPRPMLRRNSRKKKNELGGKRKKKRIRILLPSLPPSLIYYHLSLYPYRRRHRPVFPSSYLPLSRSRSPLRLPFMRYHITSSMRPPPTQRSARLRARRAGAPCRPLQVKQACAGKNVSHCLLPDSMILFLKKEREETHTFQISRSTRCRTSSAAGSAGRRPPQRAPASRRRRCRCRGTGMGPVCGKWVVSSLLPYVALRLCFRLRYKLVCIT